MNDEIRERAKAGFHSPATEARVRTRVLAGVRARAATAARRFPSGRATSLGVLFLAAAVALAVLVLPTRWVGQPKTGPSIAAALVLQRAVAAVTAEGEASTSPGPAARRSDVLHVVAETDYESPVPRLSAHRDAPGYDAGRTGTHDLRPDIDPRPDIVHVESEHWLDDSTRRRHSVSTSTFSRNLDRWSNELLVAKGVRTFVHAQKPSSGDTTTVITETDDGDWFTLGETTWADAQDQTPAQQLMDAANPRVYRSLLASGSLAPASQGTPRRVVTTPTMLGEAEVAGIAVYRLRIDTSIFFGASDSAESTISLIADLRRSDYLPVRVRGEYAGQTWTTVYRTVEWIQADKVPDDAFRIGTTVVRPRTNHRVQPGSVATSTGGAAVLWLGPQFEGLRFTGQFRTIDNTDEYEVLAEPGSAAVMADQSRPRINARYVVAEYTPDAKPGNMTMNLTETTLKVMTMPRTDSGTWERAFATAVSGMVGDGTAPDWVMQTSWTSVGGRKALLLHHRFTYGDGTVDGRIRPTFDYLVFDVGSSTVMVQGACAKPGQVQRAAEALILAK